MLSTYLSVKQTLNVNRRYDRDAVLSVSGDAGIVNQMRFMGRSYAGEDLVLYRVVDPGDVVYTKSPLKENPYGIIRTNRGEAGIVSTLYAVYQTTGAASAHFVERYFEQDDRLNRYLKPLVNKGAKNTIMVSNEQALQGEVVFPEAVEQAKVAAFIDAVDERTRVMQARRDALGEHKAGVMQGLFSRQLRFRANDGSEFPDWSEPTLGNLFAWVGTNSLARDMLTDAPGQVQNIHYGDIHGRFPARFRQDEVDVPWIRAEALTLIGEAAFCRPGDVVIADASEDYLDVGKAIEILQVRPQSLVGGLHTYIARPVDDRLVPGFAAYLFQEAGLRRRIMRIAQGVSVLSLSRGHLSKLTVSLPSPDEQRKIADLLGSLDDRIAAVDRQIAAMIRFKAALLQKMFVSTAC